MKYVSVLTPPLLVCAVFLIALIAFLRHEMGGRRSRAQDPPADYSADDPIPSRDADTPSQRRDTSDVSDDN
jgi:hypothetical protein